MGSDANPPGELKGARMPGETASEPLESGRGDSNPRRPAWEAGKQGGGKCLKSSLSGTYVILSCAVFSVNRLVSHGFHCISLHGGRARACWCMTYTPLTHRCRIAENPGGNHCGGYAGYAGCDDSDLAGLDSRRVNRSGHEP